MLLLELVSKKTLLPWAQPEEVDVVVVMGRDPSAPNPWTSKLVCGTCNVTLLGEKGPTHLHTQHGFWTQTP